MANKTHDELAEQAVETTSNESLEAAQPANTARMVLGAVALETATKLLSQTIDRFVLGTPEPAKDGPPPDPAPVKGRVRKFAAGKLASVATKSKPGAIAVAGGLFAKHLFDRGGKRMKARRAARK